ncbi:PQQ-binding-like beta-propeller repeat protein [candidate division KSB1 bacterium]|nr:PQQ-binding-like beta-propeller repeat protein [candidate division KSB1 bacterium]
MRRTHGNCDSGVPLFVNGMVIVTSGFRGNALLAIDLAKASGDITGTDAVKWTHNEDTPYTPSPILIGNTLYMLKTNRANLTRLNTATGTADYRAEKLENMGDVFASPVAVKDRIYISARKGMTSVVKHASTLEVLAQNQLDDEFEASPAIIGKHLYLRGLKYLYCIGVE